VGKRKDQAPATSRRSSESAAAQCRRSTTAAGWASDSSCGCLGSAISEAEERTRAWVRGKGHLVSKSSTIMELPAANMEQKSLDSPCPPRRSPQDCRSRCRSPSRPRSSSSPGGPSRWCGFVSSSTNSRTSPGSRWSCRAAKSAKKSQNSLDNAKLFSCSPSAGFGGNICRGTGRPARTAPCPPWSTRRGRA
jgi:hypothetical protein